MVPTYLPYAASEIFLIIFTLDILFRSNTNLGSEAETRELKRIIYAYLAVLATDILWALAEYDAILPANWLLAAINGSYLCAFTAVCYFWFKFTEARLELKLSFAVSKVLLRVPFTAAIACIILSLFTGWIFYIDEGGSYVHGKLYFIYLIGCYLYLTIAFLRAVAAFAQARTSAKRKECLVCAAYVFPPLIGQLLKPLLPTVPVLHSTMFLILQMLFLTLQENQIYNDALTGMNNRRRLDHYMEEQLPTVSDKRPMNVFMMDINDFKVINDYFGHVEGDRALIIVGKALKKAAVEFNSFIARYGGDEFCMVYMGHGHELKTVAARIQELLAETQAEAVPPTKEYTLSISVGYTVCCEAHQTPSQIIRAADEELYKAKRESKKNSVFNRP